MVDASDKFIRGFHEVLYVIHDTFPVPRHESYTIYLPHKSIETDKISEHEALFGNYQLLLVINSMLFYRKCMLSKLVTA